MFAGICTIRPWGAETGLTTKRWMEEVPIKWVRISDLIATQDGVYLHALRDGYMSEYSLDKFPHIVSFAGLLYVEDGHHRIVRAALNGLGHVQARVYVL